VWSELDEEGRYEVWSAHIDAGGEDLNYPYFCRVMDMISHTA
jgi:hypothetical protein